MGRSGLSPVVPCYAPRRGTAPPGGTVRVVDATEDEGDQLRYALYAAAHRMTKSYRPPLERIGLTYPQYRVLLVPWETDGVTVSEIGQRLRLDSVTLTPMLKRLEGALLRRNRRRSDKREVEIGRTGKGTALRAEAVAVRRGAVCQLDLSAPEVQAMRADLNHLIDSLTPGP